MAHLPEEKDESDGEEHGEIAGHQPVDIRDHQLSAARRFKTVRDSFKLDGGLSPSYKLLG